MKNKLTILILVFCFGLYNSQIKLYNKVIDSILTNNIPCGISFYLDKNNSYIKFQEVLKDETNIPKKQQVYLSEITPNILDKFEYEYTYDIFYNYKFTINGKVFYSAILTYNGDKESSLISNISIYIKSIILKLNKKKFISPQKAENIARDKGLHNIFFQSIDDHYYGLNNGLIKSIEKDVWIFKEKDNNKIRIVIINAKNGRLLEDYYQ